MEQTLTWLEWGAATKMTGPSTGCGAHRADYSAYPPKDIVDQVVMLGIFWACFELRVLLTRYFMNGRWRKVRVVGKEWKEGRASDRGGDGRTP
ncbi:hypothetical protein BC938DRAFT_476603 [Jimgerdemannia flammicorona]|uniref:Uncharacterized protein n=1 Tax=Jimgerdemannia flammicorona TaxID=994334 RepID=A0A433QQF1_9FUNG|nr:hypothetical protein BC938DRAFT_476603 [Jimgerdemannia flammicorona]